MKERSLSAYLSLTLSVCLLLIIPFHFIKNGSNAYSLPVCLIISSANVQHNSLSYRALKKLVILHISDSLLIILIPHTNFSSVIKALKTFRSFCNNFTCIHFQQVMQHVLSSFWIELFSLPVCEEDSCSHSLFYSQRMLIFVYQGLTIPYK